MGRKHRSEIARLDRDKELIVTNMKSERELLQDRVSNLQKLVEQKSRELKEEKDRSHLLIAELKVRKVEDTCRSIIPPYYPATSLYYEKL